MDSVEIINNDLIFHYSSLSYLKVESEEYYKKHCNFNKCDIVFKNIDLPYVEIKKKNALKTKIRIMYLDEFLEFMRKKSYVIDTSYFYVGYNTVYIDAMLVN